ncbi:MAG: TadE/TadG family type IV pilus assembly protein [Clostridia bacterium]|nr:TadE/TadG family type IV pilus assembly protein [Clostridia bacterium]MDR3644957.1 TadE/TadG family type IV pilus assembly protein [Clostridia bacterium]
MKRLIRFLRRRSGQSIVEFALVLPVFLLVLCGIIDFGWFYGNKLLVSYCSREGARYGAVVATQSGATSLITQRVIATVPAYMKNTLTVTVTFSSPADIESGNVTVDVAYNAQALTPVGGVFTSNQTVKLTGECIMKVE